MSRFRWTMMLVCLGVPGVLAAQGAGSQFDFRAQEYGRWLSSGRSSRPASALYPQRQVTTGVFDANFIGSPETPRNRFRDWYAPYAYWPPEMQTETFQQSRRLTKDADARHASTVDGLKWVQKGPRGMEVLNSVPTLYFSGRILAIDYSPLTGLFLGSSSGGLFGPPLLTPLTDELPTLVISAVAVHPDNPDTVFVGTGEYLQRAGAGAFRSVDGGRTWSGVPFGASVPTYIQKIIFAPWDHRTVFIAGSNGIFKSTNTGASWRLVADIDWVTDIAASTVEPAGVNTYMLAGRRAHGIYRSLDRGETWARLGARNAEAGRVSVDIPQTEWGRAYYAVARESGGGVYGVWSLTNASLGAPTWHDITPTGSAGDYMRKQGWSNNVVTSKPGSAATVWLGGVHLLRSTNYGATWIEHTGTGYEPIHPDIHAIRYNTAGTLLYVGSDGGIFTTEDDGATWSSVLNRFLPITQFYNISVSGIDGRIKWGASQDNGIEGTSVADPENWLYCDRGDGIDVAIDWNAAANMFATIGVYREFPSFRHRKTGTTGATWGPDEAGFGDDGGWNAMVVQDPGDANWFYANAGPYLYYTGDAWNWSRVNATPLSANVSSVSINADGSLLYGTPDRTGENVVGFQYVDDGGGTYHFAREYIHFGLPTLLAKKVNPSLADPDRAYVLFKGLVAYAKIFKTATRGASWTNVTGDLPNVPVNDLVENPNDPSVLWVGTDQGVYKTTNGGTNWFWWNTGMPNAVIVTDMEYVPSDSGDFLLAGTYGRSTFERRIVAPTFTVAPVHGPIYDLEYGGGELIAVADSGSTSTSFDRGATWGTMATPAAPAGLFAVALPESLRPVAAGQGGAIVRSTDGGQAWMNVNSPTQADLHGIAFATPLEGFAVGTQGTILYTSDGGQTWTLRESNVNRDLHSVIFTDPLNGWISGTEDSNQIPVVLLLHSTDGGTNWSPSQSVGPGGGCDVAFPNPMTGFLSVQGGGVFKTTDGGGSWNPLQTGVQQALHDLFFVDPQNGWACGDGGVVVHTTDGGQSWAAEETGTTDNLFAIQALDNVLLVGGAGGLITRSIPRSETKSVESSIAAGWNMLAVPVLGTSNAVQELYPGASTPAFAYDNGYVITPTMDVGLGCWLKFPAAQSVVQSGLPLSTVTLTLHQGWNLAGGISDDAPVALITTSPPGIIASSFYEYQSSYTATDMIHPGKAFWIKVSQAGDLTLTASAKDEDSVADAPLRVGAGPAESDAWISLAVADDEGRRQTLRVASRAVPPDILARYTLPPAPPDGAFDVRFGTGSSLAAPGPSATEVPVVVSSAHYPLRLSWDAGALPAGARLRIGEREIALAGRGTSLVADAGSRIALRLSPAGAPLPLAYALEQNYPNPFNPATTIRYQLPYASMVTLRITNTLGQDVALLRDGSEDAGYKQAEWNASNVASGLYFCRLEAVSLSDPGRTFTQARKLLLVK